ncbi:hypothetical protein HPP92_016030 [Vanilla planifolia]|uniref:Uncharacterized protein n=1 Tax=Vanilla planifolia TaxID=51239 RepID=A0A835QFD4_VANPL|nr:hypothetical protein HPP92_016642 [Vanilla planifolia]KAG0471484.1 hypothetical protein HPP92_016030 [Vanilla planifolia]
MGSGAFWADSSLAGSLMEQWLGAGRDPPVPVLRNRESAAETDWKKAATSGARTNAVITHAAAPGRTEPQFIHLERDILTNDIPIGGFTGREESSSGAQMQEVELRSIPEQTARVSSIMSSRGNLNRRSS